MKVRGWRETRETNAIMTPDGPLMIRQGDFVLVTIASSFEKASALAADEIRKLRKPDNG